MSGQTHSFSFSFAELYKLFFKTKKCPSCGEPRRKIKKQIDMGHGWHKETDSDGVEFEYGQKYEYKYFYCCDSCELETELKHI